MNPWIDKPQRAEVPVTCDPGRKVEPKKEKIPRVSIGGQFRAADINALIDRVNEQQEWIEAHESQMRRAIRHNAERAERIKAANEKARAKMKAGETK